MNRSLRVPPIYRLVTLDSNADLRAEARRLAEEGAEDGTLLWSVQDDRLTCAVILKPEEPLATSLQVLYVAMLGLGDALGAVVPPLVEVTFVWPNRVEANGRHVGEAQIELAKRDIANTALEWLAVCVEVAVAGAVDDEVETGDVQTTSLHHEGCTDVTPRELLESFARHFLAWVNRWQDDGFEPVRASWLHRTPGYRNGIVLDIGNERLTGTFAGLDDTGALVLETDGATRIVELYKVLPA